MKKLISNTNFYKWFEENLGKYASDIKNHHSDRYPGMTYYSETNAIYDKFEEEIFDIVEFYAQEYYGFSGLKLASNYKNVKSLITFKNQMVWLAVEYCAEEYTKTN